MVVTDLEINQKATVKKIQADSILKQRLISFGVIKGSTIKVLAVAPAKNTVEIEVGKMKIALRKAEAQKIEVELCK